MSNNIYKSRISLDSISNGVAYSLQTAPEEDVQEEAKEIFGSLSAGVDAFNKILDKAEVLANKKKLRSIRSALNKKETPVKTSTRVLSIEVARKRIEDALKRTDDSESITLAARYGEGVPDEDVIALYEDLVDLGILVDEEDFS